MDFSLLVFGDDGWGDEMLRGALMTMAVAVCSYLLGVVLGIFFASLKLSQLVVLRYAADFYTTVVRGIPELLVIYLVFFGGGTLLRSIASGLFGYEGYIDLPLFITGMVCIGLSAGAYNTEVIRGAVLAVPVGQIEAAKAIGSDGFGAWVTAGGLFADACHTCCFLASAASAQHHLANRRPVTRISTVVSRFIRSLLCKSVESCTANETRAPDWSPGFWGIREQTSIILAWRSIARPGENAVFFGLPLVGLADWPRKAQ